MLRLNDKFVNDTNTVQSPVHSWHGLVTVTSNQDKFCVHRGSDSLRGSATAVCFKFSLANYLEEKQGCKWNSALRFTDKTNLSWFLWAGTRFLQIISQQTLRSSWSFHLECLFLATPQWFSLSSYVPTAVWTAPGCFLYLLATAQLRAEKLLSPPPIIQH